MPPIDLFHHAPPSRGDEYEGLLDELVTDLRQRGFDASTDRHVLAEHIGEVDNYRDLQLLGSLSILDRPLADDTDLASLAGAAQRLVNQLKLLQDAGGEACKQLDGDILIYVDGELLDDVIQRLS